MPVPGSNLSNAKYGYDIVVATTQRSINAGLMAFFNEKHPPDYKCFIVDPSTGNPTTSMSLAEFLKTCDVNPFEIPSGTAISDERVKKLFKARFCVGIKMAMGLPPGYMKSTKLPAIVTLGESATNVGFNLFCSEISVIQLSPPNGWGGGGSFDVWTQPAGNPWYLRTTVDLTTQGLDRELKESKYFQNHEEEAKKLRAQLLNLGSMAFSLQQLVLNLNNMLLQEVPDFEGIPDGTNAQIVMEKAFRNVYVEYAKERGLPAVSISAVPDTPDPSQLQLSALDKQVSPAVSGGGGSADQLQASTLDFLCAVNNKPLPPPTRFSWKWVELSEVSQKSGVIAINRNTIARYFLDKMVPIAKRSCIRPSAKVKAYPGFRASFSASLSPDQTPHRAEVTASGDKVAHISYSVRSESKDHAGIATRAELAIHNWYDCELSFSGSRIIVVQTLKVNLYVQINLASIKCDIVHKIITDTFTLGVSGSGRLKVYQGPSRKEDKSQDPDLGGFLDAIHNLNALGDEMKKWANRLADRTVVTMSITPFQDFIFPGSKVFAYTNANFSNYGDLVCDIQYLDIFLKERHRRSDGRLIRPDPWINPPVKLEYWPELMQNYQQGEIVSPRGKFQALQTLDGNGLLFATDTSGALVVIDEHSGTSKTGWTVTDLSTATVKLNFPNDTKAHVTTFDVGQSAVSGVIHLAMAVESQGAETLFLSLFNNPRDLSWFKRPAWRRVPFDARGEPEPTMLDITNILFMETTGSEQYIVVDINRPVESKVKRIVRYHVDLSRPLGTYWTKHKLPVDIDDGSYQSCVGRVKKGIVDGIYTSGKVGSPPHPQLVYVPIVNVFDPDAPPNPRRLCLPGGVMPSAIATCRNDDTTSDLLATTDLYVVSDSTLYRFAADAQKNDALGQPLATSEFISRTESLFVMRHCGIVTVWGKNASKQVYYLSCLAGQVALPGSWSTPVPVLTGIDHVSPYINVADGGNTMFASGGGQLFKFVQETNTRAKMWRPQQIKIAPTGKRKTLSFTSYTTTLHVKDEAGLPARDFQVQLAASSRTPVYINGLYYILDEKPILVKTDDTGFVTVVEASEDLHAATLVVSVDKGSTKTTIAPMDKPYAKLAALHSVSSIRNAQIPAKIVAGGVVGKPDYVPLVPPSVSDADIDAAADSMSKLNSVRDRIANPGGMKSAWDDVDLRVVPSALFMASPSVTGIGHDIAVAAGDLFRWLKSGVKALIKIIKDTATNTWNFIATIAGKVYRAILDTVDAIVGAATWVFEQIKTGIEKLVQYAQFLFQWDDIRRTKDVMYNITKLWLHHQVDEIPRAKALFDNNVDAVQRSLREWGGIANWTALGQEAKRTAESNSSNPAQGQTSGSQMLARQFRHNAKHLVFIENLHLSTMQDVEIVVNKLLDGLYTQGPIISEVYQQLRQFATMFKSLTVEGAVRALAAILVDGLLESVQVVVDKLLDVLAKISRTVVKLLEAKIHIPVISDILEALGVPKFSLLDLFTWIAAVGFTVVYKLVHDKAPFPDSSDVKAVIAAQTWEELAGLFRPQGLPSGSSKASKELQRVLFIAGHATAGFVVFSGNFFHVLEAEAPKGSPFGIASAGMGAVGMAVQAGTDMLVPRYGIKNDAVRGISIATTIAGIVAKIGFSGVVQKYLAARGGKIAGLLPDDGRATGAIVDAVLVAPALFVTGWHFYELRDKPSGAEKSAAIVGEVSNLTRYVARVAYAVAVNSPEPTVKQTAIVAMAGVNVATAGLQTAESMIEYESRLALEEEISSECSDDMTWTEAESS